MRLLRSVSLFVLAAVAGFLLVPVPKRAEAQVSSLVVQQGGVTAGSCSRMNFVSGATVTCAQSTCNVTITGGGGGSTTLPQAYANGSTGPQVIAEAATQAGVLFRDTAGHLALPFAVQDSAGATNYLAATQNGTFATTYNSNASSSLLLNLTTATGGATPNIFFQNGGSNFFSVLDGFPVTGQASAVISAWHGATQGVGLAFLDGADVVTVDSSLTPNSTTFQTGTLKPVSNMVFSSIGSTHTISVAQASGSGDSVAIVSGGGGNSTGTGGGNGGAITLQGAAGGAGSSSSSPGAGGTLTISSGSAGATVSGFGGANSGALTIDTGAKSGTGTNGAITIGGTNAASVSLGSSGGPTVAVGQMVFDASLSLSGDVGTSAKVLTGGATPAWQTIAAILGYSPPPAAVWTSTLPSAGSSLTYPRFVPSVSGHVGTISCGWTAAGSGGTRGVVATILENGTTTKCTCTVSTCGAAQGSCSCNGAFTSGNYYEVNFNIGGGSGSDCVVMPSNIICGSEILP